MGIILLDQVEQSNDDMQYKHAVYHLKKPIIPQNLHRVLFECLKAKGLLINAPAFMVEKEIQPITKRNRSANDKKQLLLVEDNEINQEVAMELLSDLGYEVDVAEHGQNALEILNAPRTKQYDAILMDCQMPVLDGYETTRIIRKSLGEKINSNVPIIAVTANAMKGDKEKCIKAGMDDYLSKPLNLKNLKEMLERWIGQ
jgi:CheY-like chemotaxis protein